MPYKTAFEVCENHIRIEVQGSRTPGNVASDSCIVMQETMELIEKTGITNCLLFLDLSGPLSPMDAFDLVTMSEEVGWQRKYRVAMVNLNAASGEDVQFTEIVAANRAYPVRVFDNDKDALDWLLQ